MQESLEASLVRMRTTDGRVVGAGFLVGERQVLTCAHVVKQALGLAHYPLDPPQGVISLDFPLLPLRTLFTAKVILWCPPLPDGRGDIAGLELLGEPPAGPGVTPAGVPVATSSTTKQSLTRSIYEGEVVSTGEATAPRYTWAICLRTSNLMKGFLHVPAAARGAYPPPAPREGEKMILRAMWFEDGTRF